MPQRLAGEPEPQKSKGKLCHATAEPEKSRGNLCHSARPGSPSPRKVEGNYAITAKPEKSDGNLSKTYATQQPSLRKAEEVYVTAFGSRPGAPEK